MTNSIIFFKSGKVFLYNHWDCCQSLGETFIDNRHPVMYVGIPIIEMDPFFMIRDNLNKYMEFITEVFDISYRVTTEDEKSDIDLSSYGNDDKDLILIRIERRKDKVITNKYFNASYNIFRYLWYKHYTNMAILSTNLYKLNIIKDTIDILAISCSYQQSRDRALLPTTTDDLEGLLFFREKKSAIPELLLGKNFNNVFYRFPIYFNPIVTINGSFFEEVKTTIEAKEYFRKLISIEDITEISPFILNNINLIYDDYLFVKKLYMEIITFLEEKKLSIPFGNPLLLSRDIKMVTLDTVNYAGNLEKVKINL